MSPAVYIFVSWAMCTWLHGQPSLRVSVAGSRQVCSKYADDTKALLCSLGEQHVSSFLDVM
jgi:hypothetical protein